VLGAIIEHYEVTHMRLYLSSFRLGNHPEKLVDLTKGNMRAAIVINACDYQSNEERSTRVRQEADALESLGFSPFELDLRQYFKNRQNQEELRDALAGSGLIWVRGGNSFVLRRAMRISNFDKLIFELLTHDAVAYGGFSAGMVMLTPSLCGVELVDDPKVIPTGYDPAIIWEGLRLISYAIAPHYKSDHPESAATDNLVQYYIDNHMLFKTLHDGEAIVVNGNQEEIVT
jgi:dipeptidase E